MYLEGRVYRIFLMRWMDVRQKEKSRITPRLRAPYPHMEGSGNMEADTEGLKNQEGIFVSYDVK